MDWCVIRTKSWAVKRLQQNLLKKLCMGKFWNWLSFRAQIRPFCFANSCYCFNHILHCMLFGVNCLQLLLVQQRIPLQFKNMCINNKITGKTTTCICETMWYIVVWNRFVGHFHNKEPNQLHYPISETPCKKAWP